MGPLKDPSKIASRHAEPVRKALRLIKFADNAVCAGHRADAETLIKLAYRQFDLAPLPVERKKRRTG
jgi:hypothetical protein